MVHTRECNKFAGARFDAGDDTEVDWRHSQRGVHRHLIRGARRPVFRLVVELKLGVGKI